MYSIAGHLDVSMSDWPANVFEPGQNAISTLLQPSIVPGGLEGHRLTPASGPYNPPTTRDIPPVTLTDIQQVRAAEFEAYISQVGALYEQLQQIKDSEYEAQAKQESKSDAFQGNERPGTANCRSQSTRKTPIASVTSMNTPVHGLSHRRGSGSSCRGNYSSPSLSIIPSIYFDEKFHLENPRTFHVVSERSDIIHPSPITSKASNENATELRKSLATNAILQEKLSWYMDIAEVHLIDSISTASTTLLSALNFLRELHLEAAELVENIKVLRKDLVLLSESMVTGGLKLLQKQRIHYNLQQMQDTVQQMKRVVDGVAYSEFLVENGEVEKALTEIDAIELLIIGERDKTSGKKALPNSQLRDIRGATLLRGVAGDLANLRFRIGKVFEDRIQSLLIGDLRRHIQSVSAQEALSGWRVSLLRDNEDKVPGISILPAYMSTTDELRLTLSPSISGLYRSRSVSTAILAYRETVLQEIRNIVRGPLPPSTEDAESVTSASTIGRDPNRANREKSSILARNIRSLDAGEAERLFSTIFTGVTETLKRVKTQSSVLLDIACTIGNTDTEDSVKFPTVLEFQKAMHSIFDVSNLLSQAVDISHEKINKILHMRSEQTIGLPLASFLRYFTLNLLFVNECESISGQAGTSLRSIVNSHIQDYITAHGDRENKMLIQGMSSDNWQDKDFTTKDTEILEQILQCSTSNPTAWTESSKIWAPLSRGESKLNYAEDSTVRDKIRGAIIDEETFLLPHSAILCLEGISHFLRLIGGIPLVTTEVTRSLISYLQMFDSRCRQLILGAGAMLSAGLRNITTVNLVVALQAVTFIATIIPYIREFVRRHAPLGRPSASLMGEFDKVRHALQEHQEAIYEKLVEIMASRARIYSKKAREIKWSREKPEDVREYVADLARDTNKLYKALRKRRPVQVVERVMAPVFMIYKEQMGNVFKEADPATELGRDCMLRDVGYLTDKFGTIEGFGDLNTSLIKIIEDKEIEAAPPAPDRE
ncbi:putative GARP complex component [Xylaria intraflava]|nr:putative GARP complex component [Xylaria intraflava]